MNEKNLMIENNSYENLYKKAVDELNPSPELILKIKEGRTRKVVQFSKKKIAVLVAVACMIAGTTAFAAGPITSLISWSSPWSESTDYRTVCEYAEKADLKASIPKVLSNGYEFTSSNIGRVKGVDNDGNTLASGEKFQVTYKKENAPDLSFYVDPVFETENHEQSVESRELGGIEVYYNEDTYKCVPADYELTKEDKENMEKPHYYISSGSDQEQVENKTLQSIVFVIDGKNYSLLSWDNELSAEEWFAMAEEFVKQR